MRIAFAYQIIGQILGGRMLGWTAKKIMPDAVRFMIGVERGKIPAQSR